MDTLRYITLDPKPTLCVILIGAGVVLALRAAETWADRRTKQRTQRALQEIEREHDART